MIVIPMAGLSSRFFKAGYDKPKYMLNLHGRPIFDYAMASFRAQFKIFPFLFICRDIHGTAEFVRARCIGLGIKGVNIVILTETTSGQGETVMLGLELADISDDEPITIFNIDSFRKNFEFSNDCLGEKSFLEVFRGKGNHWSFVEPALLDAFKITGNACRVIEKNRISDLCCTGLYHFRSVLDFRQGYRSELMAPSQKLSETYIAPIYNQLIARGHEVQFKVIDQAVINFCGVPSEYDNCRANPYLASKFFGK